MDHRNLCTLHLETAVGEDRNVRAAAMYNLLTDQANHIAEAPSYHITVSFLT